MHVINNFCFDVFKMYWPFGAQIVSFLGLVILLFYLFIISMTKLLDADWLRGVQLFH
jgi:hypothetical protein